MSASAGERPVRADALGVLRWMEQRQFRGVDPFDALSSPLAAPLRPLRWPAVAWVQIHRRLPLDLRPLIGVRPHTNPKALSLTVQGLLDLGAPEDPALRARAEDLIHRLVDLADPGGGWGYPFPWANRHFRAAAGMPSSVVTAFVGHALLDARQAGVAPESVDESVLAGAGFLATHLGRVPCGDGFLFSYTPADSRGVHNASLLAASFLARAARLEGADPDWTDDARTAAVATRDAQRPDGSWPYGTSRRDDFVDSFHTGYVLEALRRLDQLGVLDSSDAVDAGLAYWRATFLTGSGVAHRPGVPHPVDLHAVAQAILTCLQFEDRWPGGPDTASELAAWAVQHARGPDGAFDYLWRPGRSNKVRYLRWVQAWMFRALSALAGRLNAG
ncbi:MAG: hypothetical protein RJQ04_03515 [Longimicrobiales bacterium]